MSMQSHGGANTSMSGDIENGGPASQHRCDEMATHVLDMCLQRGLCIAAAESLTGGLLADSFVRIPGASNVFLGSAVTYDIAAKASLLDVDTDILDTYGAVDPRVAAHMAQATATLYSRPDIAGKVIGLSTTGVAGPGPDGDKPAGLVYIGIYFPRCIIEAGSRMSASESISHAQVVTHDLHLHGSREDIRRQTVSSVLQFLESALLSTAEPQQ